MPRLPEKLVRRQVDGDHVIHVANVIPHSAVRHPKVALALRLAGTAYDFPYDRWQGRCREPHGPDNPASVMHTPAATIHIVTNETVSDDEVRTLPN